MEGEGGGGVGDGLQFLMWASGYHTEFGMSFLQREDFEGNERTFSFRPMPGLVCLL